MPVDDLATTVGIDAPPQRVVSLVPSLTEAIAVSAPDLLVGATDWCTHPADLDVARVRGTKNPKLAAIADLSPDLVVANKEENRELDVRRLRERGVPVWVTDIEDVPSALSSMRRLFTEALRREVPDWLERAEGFWGAPAPAPRGRVVVPIWRDPWMVVGPRTYTTDVLVRLGWGNAFAGPDADPDDRYPHVDLEQIDRGDIDLALLPDEPYEFTADDGPEAFAQVPTRLVSGRLLTWYGPAMVEAYEILSRD
ncbi:MAG: helical backbone metal receptor [Janibacter sp.]